MDRNYTETAKYKEYVLFRKLETADDNTAPKIVLAINLTRLRYQCNKGQTEVARCLGINQKNLSQWEQGDVVPSLRYLIALAKFYGVSIDQLLTLPDLSILSSNNLIQPILTTAVIQSLIATK